MSTDFPCKYGHNNCAVKDGGNCSDEMNRDREDREYKQYLDELQAEREAEIKNECGQGRHNWTRYYGGQMACSRCHLDIEDNRK